MIKFLNNSLEAPFCRFRKCYENALFKEQEAIQAACISSYNTHSNEIDSRYVNIKFLDNTNFIFFSNYNSPKSLDFSLHKQAAIVFFWPSINSQIRIKANIEKCLIEFNNKYFMQRSPKKNALAISSNQSCPIKSFDEVIRKYSKTLSDSNLLDCPNYWGGFKAQPYSIEFWEGGRHRLNKRDIYTKNSSDWNQCILEP